MENKEWSWDGTIWEFVDVIKWSLVFRRLGREKPEGWTDIVNNPDLVKKKAAEYGMNECWEFRTRLSAIGWKACGRRLRNTMRETADSFTERRYREGAGNGPFLNYM